MADEYSIELRNPEEYMEDYINAVYWWGQNPLWKKLNIELNPSVPQLTHMAKAGLLFYIVLKKDGEDKPIGHYLGVKQEFLFNPEYLMATEVFWSIEQGFTGKGISKIFLEKVNALFKEWGINLVNCSFLHRKDETDEQANKRMASLEALGYTKVDTIFYKRI